MANVDTAEIEKFENLASRWWDKNSEFKPLHDINPLRANYIDRRSPVAERLLLDVGCGGGILTEAMAQRGAKATGIDMGAAPLAVARLHAKESQLDIDYQQITAEELAEKTPGHYDIVTCLEMLEHVPDAAYVMQVCASLVRHGGDVYFSTINRTTKAYLFAILGAEYVLNLMPKGTHDDDKIIRAYDMRVWFRAFRREQQDT